MMVDTGASEWAATRLLDKVPKTLARFGLTPSRATRDKAVPVGPGRRRLSRLESGTGEWAAAVTRLLDKPRLTRATQAGHMVRVWPPAGRPITRIRTRRPVMGLPARGRPGQRRVR